MNTQIKALRKAFNTLADVVSLPNLYRLIVIKIMEELDSIKADVFRDFQDSNAAVYRKIEELAGQVAKLQNEKQEQKVHVVSLEQ